jgi:hypothetical protein
MFARRMAWNGDDYMAMLQVLSMDQFDTFDRLQGDPYDQGARRTWLRTLCSQVEAFAFATKQMLAGFAEFPWVKLNPHDVLLLREEAYEITNNGEVKLRGDKFVRVGTNLRFIAKISNRALELGYTLDTSGPGWDALMATIDVRNRLVHPKAAADLLVTDDEYKTAMLAHKWFQTMHVDLWNKINVAFRDKTRQP